LLQSAALGISSSTFDMTQSPTKPVTRQIMQLLYIKRQSADFDLSQRVRAVRGSECVPQMRTG
jgi:hypothetical protein